MHIGNHSHGDSMHKTYTSRNDNPAWRALGEYNEFPALAEQLFVLDSCSEREREFLLVV